MEFSQPKGIYQQIADQMRVDREIIENQRGLGYFVATDAKKRIVAQMREEFVRDELPKIIRTMRVLGMQLADLEPYFVQLNGEQAS
jgi:DNA-binding transcriptional regulator YhcF (GntR family)